MTGTALALTVGRPRETLIDVEGPLVAAAPMQEHEQRRPPWARRSPARPR